MIHMYVGMGIYRYLTSPNYTKPTSIRARIDNNVIKETKRYNSRQRKARIIWALIKKIRIYNIYYSILLLYRDTTTPIFFFHIFFVKMCCYGSVSPNYCLELIPGMHALKIDIQAQTIRVNSETKHLIRDS